MDGGAPRRRGSPPFPVSPGGGPGTARSGREAEGRRWVEHGVEQVEEQGLLGGAGRKSWNDALLFCCRP